MKAKITSNNSGEINIYYSGKIYRLRKSEYVYLETAGDIIDLRIGNSCGSKVILDWGDIFIDAFMGNSILTFTQSDYFCRIKGNEFCEVIVQPVSEDKGKIIYSSFCAQVFGGEVVSEDYKTYDLKKTKRKFRRRQLFFTSGLILYLLLVAFCAVLNDWDNMFLSFFIFLVYTLPSIVQSVKYKKRTSDEYIKNILVNSADELRKADFDILKTEPKSKTEKIFYKIIKKMFKWEDQ